MRDRPTADVHLLARVSADGETMMDYYVLPAAAVQTLPTALKIRNGVEIDRFRVRDLSTAIEKVVSFSAGC